MVHFFGDNNYQSSQIKRGDIKQDKYANFLRVLIDFEMIKDV